MLYGIQCKKLDNNLEYYYITNGKNYFKKKDVWKKNCKTRSDYLNANQLTSYDMFGNTCKYLWILIMLIEKKKNQKPK